MDTSSYLEQGNEKEEHIGISSKLFKQELWQECNKGVFPCAVN